MLDAGVFDVCDGEGVTFHRTGDLHLALQMLLSLRRIRELVHLLVGFTDKHWSRAALDAAFRASARAFLRTGVTSSATGVADPAGHLSGTCSRYHHAAGKQHA